MRRGQAGHASASAFDGVSPRLPSDPAAQRGGPIVLRKPAGGSSLVALLSDDHKHTDSREALAQYSPRLRTGRVAGLPSNREAGPRAKRMTDLLAAAAILPPTLEPSLQLADVQVFADEAAIGKVAVPVLEDFRDVLKVIDARERSLQNIRTFLASQCFIRGNSRRLPPGVLRRGRAKLARLLARQRAHSTIAIELIQKWRERNAPPLPAPAAAADSDGGLPPMLQNILKATELPGKKKVGEPVDVSAEGGEEAVAAGRGGKAMWKVARPPVSSTMALAMTAAMRDGPKLTQRTVKRPPATDSEPFMWMGTNYLLKMAHDMKYSPLPMAGDPLLLTWFHFEPDPNLSRADSFMRPWFLEAGAQRKEEHERLFGEQEWWFDAERLHTPADLRRMRAAAQVVLDEIAIEAARAKMRAGGGAGGDPAAAADGEEEEAAAKAGGASLMSAINRHVLLKPGNDIGREMEVLLYGGDGGFALKLQSMEDFTSKAVQIQCLYGSFSLVRRVQKRRQARVLVAALYIQKLYKRRLHFHLSDKANRLATAAAQHRKDYLAEREAKVRAEMHQRELSVRQEQRGHVLRRRWMGVRSAVAEIKERTTAAVMLQCRVRARKARRLYRHQVLTKKSRMRELQADVATPKAQLIQARLRAHRAATRLLVDQYTQRVQWYDDSRTSTMMAPLAKHVSLKRQELQTTLRGLRPELERVTDAPSQHAEALKKLWAVQGEVSLLEHILSHPSVDTLMKRRLEFKLALSGAYITLERTERTYTGLIDEYATLLREAHKVRGSLEVMEGLQLASETVTVTTAGQSETLRRKLAYLETRLDASRTQLDAAQDAYHAAVRSERMSSNALAVCSQLLSRHAVFAPQSASSPAERTAPQVPASAVTEPLSMRKAQLPKLESDAAKAQRDVATQHALQIVCHWAEGGLTTLQSLQASTFRQKLTRLERRRSEALGHCIATANAKIAYRVCKQSMAELHGARELLGELKQQQATMPRATLEFVLTLPASCRVDASVCERVLEDIATWMGVTDNHFRLGSFETLEGDAGGKGGKINLLVVATLHREPAGAHPPNFAPEPTELAQMICDEFIEGRLSGALQTTADALEVPSIQIQNVTASIPPKAELASHCPTLTATVKEAEYELNQTLSYISHCDQLRREEQELVELRTTPLEEQKVAARHLLARREISFFEVPLAQESAGASPSSPGARRSPSPTISPEQQEQLRQAIVNDPIAAQAVAIFSGIRAHGRASESPSTPRISTEGSHHGADDDDGRGSPDSVSSSAAPSPARSGLAAVAARARLAQTALGTVKGRLTYAKMRRDALRGKLEAIEQLRTETTWPAVYLEGDPSPVNLDWNKGLPTPPNAGGRFCAYCALRSPPVLARHRFVECYHRQLSGQPEFSLEALRALEARLDAKEDRVREHLRRFATVVARRKKCKLILAEVQGVLRYLKPGEAIDEMPLPIGPPPKSLEPLCRVRAPGHTAWVRFLARVMRQEASDRTHDLRGLGLHGGMHGGVWGELKALLVMTPRRSLMLGGMRQLAKEANRRHRAQLDLPMLPPADGGSPASVMSGTPAAAADGPAPYPEEEGDDEQDEEDAAMLSALELLEASSSSDGGGASAQASGEAITETIACAMATAPMRTIASDEDVSILLGGGGAATNNDPLAAATDHLPSAQRLRASELHEGKKNASAQTWAADNDRDGRRRGSLAHELRKGSAPAFIDPEMVRREAQRLGVDLSEGSSEFYLLPLVVESCRAPLPGGWQEVLVDDEVLYVEETNLDNGPQREHPLAEAFSQLVGLEKRRVRRKSSHTHKVPSWLVGPSERWVQFVDAYGRTYCHDFGTGQTVDELTDVLDLHDPSKKDYTQSTSAVIMDTLTAEGEEVAVVADEIVNGAVQRLSGGDDGAPAAAEESPAAAEAPASSSPSPEPSFTRRNPPISMSELLDMLRKPADKNDGGKSDRILADEIARNLRATFHQVLGASLAAAPRPLSHTLEVAIRYGLQIETEGQYLWLANLALALPLPAGWVQVDHPTQPQATFWHNEICCSSQWQHPVDDFVKATVKMQRQPTSPQVQAMRRSRGPRRRSYVS